jgi:hypothetical protein
MNGEMRSTYEILIGISDGKIPFRSHMRRWEEDNIKVAVNGSA